jgi:uncharacterized protein (UPF0332 family)/predicted nucleotidyltransferase
VVRAQSRNEKAAREFSRRLVEKRPEVVAVVLYGSVARGEAHDDSDVDLMVLADLEDAALSEDALCLAMEIGDEFDVFVQEIVEGVDRFASRAMQGYPLQRTIARIGVPLHDRGDFARIRAGLPPQPSEVAEQRPEYRPSEPMLEDLMATASQALRDASILLNLGSWDGASNRAYYAMFNAASAAVLACGVEEIRSHKAVVDLFGKYLVHERGLHRSNLRDLQKAFRLRLRADYERGFHVDEAAARDVLSAAQRFVNVIRGFLSPD